MCSQEKVPVEMDDEVELPAIPTIQKWKVITRRIAIPRIPSSTGIRPSECVSPFDSAALAALCKSEEIAKTEFAILAQSRVQNRGIRSRSFRETSITNAGLCREPEGAIRIWSGRRESNPYLRPGRPQFCQLNYTRTIVLPGGPDSQQSPIGSQSDFLGELRFLHSSCIVDGWRFLAFPEK